VVADGGGGAARGGPQQSEMFSYISAGRRVLTLWSYLGIREMIPAITDSDHYKRGATGYDRVSHEELEVSRGDISPSAIRLAGCFKPRS